MHHRRGREPVRRNKGRKIIELVAGVKFAGLETAASDQRIAGLFPDLIELAGIGGECVVVMQIHRKWRNEMQRAVRISANNQSQANIGEWSHSVPQKL